MLLCQKPKKVNKIICNLQLKEKHEINLSLRKQTFLKKKFKNKFEPKRNSISEREQKSKQIPTNLRNANNTANSVNRVIRV